MRKVYDWLTIIALVLLTVGCAAAPAEPLNSVPKTAGPVLLLLGIFP